jgi:drug/metabolite transporter (DMT)-like permease
VEAIGASRGATRRMPRAAYGWSIRFLLLSAIWGFSFLLIKIAERELAPVQVTFGRMLLGALALVAIVALRRQPLPSGRMTWLHLCVVGVLLTALPFTLIAYGERHVTSVVAGIWNATTPLFTLPLAIALIAEERATRQRAVGLLIGFAGVLTVLGIWRSHGTTSLEGNLMCMAAALCYGLNFPYTRRFLARRQEGPLSLAAGQLICGTVGLAIAAPLLSSAPAATGAGPVASVIVLGCVGTGIAFVLNYSVIRDAGATVASTVTYVMPIFSTSAGILLLSERLFWNQPFGAVVILLGAAIAQGRLRVRAQRA